VSPPSTPQIGDRLRTLKLAKVREGKEMSSPEAGQLDAGEMITVLDTGTSASGTLRVKYDGGWVSVRTSVGEQVLEAVARDDQSEVLDQLIELYKEKNGCEPTDDDVKQWVATLREAAEEQPTSNAPAAAATGPSIASQTGSMGAMMGMPSGPPGDPLGLGQAHLKPSDLGLPSFGLQKTPAATADDGATVAAAAAPVTRAATAPPSGGMGLGVGCEGGGGEPLTLVSELGRLNRDFQAWVGQQLARPGQPLDLSPGLLVSITAAALLPAQLTDAPARLTQTPRAPPWSCAVLPETPRRVARRGGGGGGRTERCPAATSVAAVVVVVRWCGERRPVILIRRRRRRGRFLEAGGAVESAACHAGGLACQSLDSASLRRRTGRGCRRRWGFLGELVVPARALGRRA
jgi:hypothetical protein